MSMKRILISLGSVGAVTCFSGVAQAGGHIWSDNFDGYALNSEIVGQGGWEAWFNDPGAEGAFVTNAQAFSGGQSLQTSGVEDTVRQYDEFNIGGGVWIYDTQIYIPSDMTGTAYFIMLNDFNHGGGENWSTQISMTPGGVVNSEFENASVDIITDAWVHLRVLIDLDNDVQSITYGGAHLTQKSWQEGVSGGGNAFIDTVDLWGNAAGVHYYDEIGLQEAPQFGACCLPDGSCDADVDQGTCDGNGGNYQGDGSTCATADATLACLAIGDCGTILNLPDENGSNFTLGGTTCGGESGCNLVSSNDFQAEIILPFDAEWTIDLCGSDYDTVLKIGSDCCTQDIANIDDTAGCGNGLQSSFTGDLKAGTYFVTVEGINQAACGNYVLGISTACIVEPPKGASDEGEPDCGLPVDTVNSGCNDLVNLLFGETFCGDVIAGSTADDTATRDTDWFTLIVEENTTVNLSMFAENDINFGFIQYNEGAEGSGDCADISGFVSPFGSPLACSKGDVSADLTPGTWWIWVGGNFDGVDCPSNYVLSVECEGGADCPWDLSGDGTVNGTDLILLLGAWGDPWGTPDLIELLGAWGDCE